MVLLTHGDDLEYKAHNDVDSNDEKSCDEDQGLLICVVDQPAGAVKRVVLAIDVCKTHGQCLASAPDVVDMQTVAVHETHPLFFFFLLVEVGTQLRHLRWTLNVRLEVLF